jgi:hypothetical protein
VNHTVPGTKYIIVVVVVIIIIIHRFAGGDTGTGKQPERKFNQGRNGCLLRVQYSGQSMGVQSYLEAQCKYLRETRFSNTRLSKK